MQLLMLLQNSNGGFSGVLFVILLGLTVYLGKVTKHADWVLDNNEIEN
jgi:hypothetical protein